MILSKDELNKLRLIHKKHLSKKYCMHPDAPDLCSGGMIKAHTVQKNGGISSIAHEGKVYVARNDLMSVFNNCGKIDIKLLGLNDATTFYGFCQKHDCEIFLPIETSDVVAGDEHCFLLGYRAICKELYLKNAHVSILEDSKQLEFFNDPAKKYGLNEQLRSECISRKEVSEAKSIYDSTLKSKCYEDFKFVSIELQDIPPVLCSSYISISKDMYGNAIQDPCGVKKPLHSISYSIVSSNNKGFVVFQWHRSANRIALHVLQQFFSASPISISRYIMGIVFLCLENFVISPLWWDGLPVGTKNKLLSLMNDIVIYGTGLRPLLKLNCGDEVVLKQVNTNFTPLRVAVAKTNREITRGK